MKIVWVFFFFFIFFRIFLSAIFRSILILSRALAAIAQTIGCSGQRAVGNDEDSITDWPVSLLDKSYLLNPGSLKGVLVYKRANDRVARARTQSRPRTSWYKWLFPLYPIYISILFSLISFLPPFSLTHTPKPALFFTHFLYALAISLQSIAIRYHPISIDLPYIFYSTCRKK